VGVEAIRANSLHQTQMIIERADALGYPVRSPRAAEERAGTVTIQPPNAYEVSRELLAQQFIVDYREGAGIRIAPHFYNTEAEIEAVMHTIEEILIRGTWQRHQRGRTFVT